MVCRISAAPRRCRLSEIVLKPREAIFAGLQLEDRHLTHEPLPVHRSRREAGPGGQAFQVHQPLWLRNWRRIEDWRVRRDPKERQGRETLEDLEPHLRL